MSERERNTERVRGRESESKVLPGVGRSTQHFTAVLHNIPVTIGVLDPIFPGPRAFDLRDGSQPITQM